MAGLFLIQLFARFLEYLWLGGGLIWPAALLAFAAAFMLLRFLFVD